MSTRHSTRPMASWIPEPAAVPPSGFTMPLAAPELALLADFRRLPPHEKRLIGDIVTALAEGREEVHS